MADRRIPAFMVFRVLSSRALLQMIVAAAVLFALSAAFVYANERGRAAERTQAVLDAHLVSVLREQEARFQRLELVERQAARQFERRYRADNPVDEALFERLFPLASDGTRRSAPDLFDGTILASGAPVSGIGAFISGAEPLTRSRKRALLAAFHTLRAFAETAHPDLDSFYFFTPDNDLLIFAPDRPDRLQYYRRDAPADFGFQDREFAEIATFSANPRRALVCTGLRPIIYDQAERVWSTACVTPVDVGTRHIGSWGSSLLLGELFRARPSEEAPDAKVAFVSGEGQLIYHPDFTRPARAETWTHVDLAHAAEPELAGLWEFLSLRWEDEMFAGYSPEMDAQVALGRIGTPGWIAITYVPGASVRAEARHAAMNVLIIGIAAVCLLALMLHAVLRREVVAPIARIVARVDDIVPGKDAGGRAQGTLFQNELDYLAERVGAMADRVDEERERLIREIAEAGRQALAILARDNGRGKASQERRAFRSRTPRDLPGKS